MTRGALVLLALALAGCSSPEPARPSPPPPPPSDPTPAIVLRGDATPRPVAPPEPGPDPALIEALRREAARPGQTAPTPAPVARGDTDLPVVLGDAQAFRLRVDAAATAQGRWSATVELQNATPHAWAVVEVTLELLEGRRPLDATRVRLERLERGARRTVQVEGACPPGADRVRASVASAEPQPGEADVAWRARRLCGFDVRGARLLRSRSHELDAILELGGGPLEHIPWSGADVLVRFFDDRGEAITAGRARLTRGDGPPWRLHVVGADPSRAQVALIEVDVEDLRFD